MKFLFPLIVCLSCTQQKKPNLPKAPFASQQIIAELETEKLEEASGLEYSVKNPNHFWSHNDSGGTPSLFLFDEDGNIIMEVLLEGMVNRDWEEITLEESDNNSFIYIAEIGDNRANHSSVSIHKIEEPLFNGQKTLSIPFEKIETMEFQYAEGARDAEALMFDYSVDELVLITKRENKSMVYSFPFVSTKEITTISSLGSIPDRNFTAADATPSGEVLLKHYGKIYFWESDSLSIANKILKWNPMSVKYRKEPQGEAMCWAGDDFYTLTEKNNSNQNILFFQREK